jgi:hypothetical protein
VGAINSNLATAFIGGLTGAFGGALGAQRIVERSKRRDDLIKELRNINAAIMVTVSTCNAALTLKKQHVQPMYEQFEKEKAALSVFMDQRAKGQISGDAEYRFMADLKTYPAPTVPIETLKDLVYSKISAYGRPLALVAVLEQLLVGLRDAIAKRDTLVQRFASGVVPAEQLSQYYFGMPLRGGDTNQEYPDLAWAIHSYVDDVVFFSQLLCSDLIKHGNEIRDAYSKKYGKGVQKVSTANFSGPREKGLIPPDSQYSDWLNAFVSDDTDNANNKRKQ